MGSSAITEVDYSTTGRVVAIGAERSKITMGADANCLREQQVEEAGPVAGRVGRFGIANGGRGWRRIRGRRKWRKVTTGDSTKHRLHRQWQ